MSSAPSMVSRKGGRFGLRMVMTPYGVNEAEGADTGNSVG